VDTSAGSALGKLRGTLKSFAYSGPRRDRWQHPDRVLAALEVQPGQRVADLGSGGGYFTFRLADAVGPQGKVYAVDTDRDMRARVGAQAGRRGYANVVTVESGPDDPALPEPVDLIVVVDTFHHLPATAAYGSALADAVRPGGRLAVIEALPRWFLFGHATEPQRIRSLLEEAGFVVVAEHGFLPRQSFIVFERPAP
jgi:arsenite methyltransferase